MKNNKQIIIYGDGKQSRDFVSVEQVVNANLKLAMLDGKYLNGQAVNIATGKSINLFELIVKLKANYQSYKQEIIFKPARTGDILNSKASCQKLTYFYKLLSK